LGPLTSRTPCPPWCTVNHDQAAPGSVRDSVHIAAEASVSTRGGDVRTCAWWSGSSLSAPDVFLSLPARAGVNGRLSLPPSDAVGLAELLELLATATPGQHRELARQVRHAAAVLDPEAGGQQ
jgi:hypothetical protein